MWERFAKFSLGLNVKQEWDAECEGEGKQGLTGSGSGARGGGVGEGGRVIHGAGVEGEVGVVGEEGSVGEVDLDEPAPRGPLRRVEDAGVHSHGLLAQVWVSMGFVVLEHPDQHVVHVHPGHASMAVT